MSFLHPSTGITKANVAQVLVSFFSMATFCSNAGSVNAGVRVNNDGTIDLQDNCGPFSFDQNFLSVGGFAGAADDFECRLEVNGGDFPTGGAAIDTWHPLTSGRSFTWDDFMIFASGDWQLLIREVADVGNSDSQQYIWMVEDGS